MTTILVLGGNIGGMTSAFELHRKLRTKARVVVVSRQKEFVYIPSRIWMPFGRRTLEDITFSAEETLRKGGIEFVHDEAVRIRPEANTVDCASGQALSYEVLANADRTPAGRAPEPYEGALWQRDDGF
jgi:sulfide:quinone oxidoreductase